MPQAGNQIIAHTDLAPRAVHTGPDNSSPLFQSVRIDESELRRVRRHAEAASPNECCGLLFGLRDKSNGTIICAAQPSDNLDCTDPSQAYLIDPADVLRALRDGHLAGQLLGFYHSHPMGSSNPSRRDHQQAWPGYLYFIACRDGCGEWNVEGWQASRTGQPPALCSVLIESAGV